MAFKSVKQYNEERYGGLFRLVNDGDSADVIFLYRDVADVLVGDTHYIKSADYSGYVHCGGRGCPACGKGLRVQTKLFVPLYNLTANEIQFWDRSVRFENQLSSDVFSKCPNPSEFVFKIIRHGAAGDINTVYEITLVARNSEPYDQILTRFNIKMPDYYDTICKEFSNSELADMLAKPDTANNYGEELPDYSVTPRAAAPVPTEPSSMIPEVYESVPQDTPINAAIPEPEFDNDEGDDVDDVSF